MMNLFSENMRRNPYPAYDQLRTSSPLLRVPPPFDGWMILDYDGVKWALTDHETFSSRVPAPRNWFIFLDASGHTKLRALIWRAFTPRMIENLEPRIEELSSELLDGVMNRRQIDLAAEFSVPLPMKVIAMRSWGLVTPARAANRRNKPAVISQRSLSK
jgi:cytochrome P450